MDTFLFQVLFLVVFLCMFPMLAIEDFVQLCRLSVFINKALVLTLAKHYTNSIGKENIK